MLTEIAITPQVFDRVANAGDPNWGEAIRELNRCLVYWRDGGCPMILADLLSGECIREIVKRISAITEQNVRRAAEGFLTQLKQLRAIVERPPTGGASQAKDEIAWVAEAAAVPQEHFRVDRILATAASCGPLGSQKDRLFPPLSVVDHEFLRDATVTRSVPMDINQQVLRLRPLWTYAGFISLVLPYAHGDRYDETEFYLQLARKVKNRPPGLPTILLDLHTARPKVDPEPKMDMLRCRLEETRPSGGSVRLFIWPEKSLLDRYLFAGDSLAGDGSVCPGHLRWTIHLGHTARLGKQGVPTRAATQWSLLSRSDGDRRLSEYYGAKAPVPIAI